MLDPTFVAAGAGLLASVAAGRALTYTLQFIQPHHRRTAEWALIVGAALAAILGDLFVKGPVAERAFVFVLATLPGLVAYLAWRTLLASLVVSLVPVYFFIGGLTSGRTLHMPVTSVDRAVTLEPAWMFVYGSLYVFVLLLVLVVRQPQLFRRALQAYVMVMIVAYAGFIVYPTLTPRPAMVAGDGFAAWSLRLMYALDTRYNCFPCLHVAHSLVSALASYRVHRRVGLMAAAWTALVGVSTLYTKQHYFVDVVAGALIAYVAYLMFLRGFPREAVPERDRQLAPRRALGVIAIYGIFVFVFWVLYATGVVVA